MGAIVCELVFRNRIAGSEDYTFASWPVVICSQFVQALSIMTACVPYLKPFFASLESGMIRSDDSRRLDTRSTSNLGYSKSSGQKKSFSSMLLRSNESKKGGTGIVSSSHEDATINFELKDSNGQSSGAWETGSQTSQARMVYPTAV